MVFSAPVDVQLDCDEKTMVQPDVLVVCDREKIVPTHVYGFLDSLRQLEIGESVYDKDYFQEYNGMYGRYYIDEEDKEIYELIDEKYLYSLGNYKTETEFYSTNNI